MPIKNYSFNPENYKSELLKILVEIDSEKTLSEQKFQQILTKHPKDDKGVFSKNNLVIGYKYLESKGDLAEVKSKLELLKKIQMKPVRTQSGVTPVTILTKPFPCPGQCIFCPNDIRMPKSYLSDEPGAQRAERNNFDPYLQTYDRLQALKNIGHNTDKVEIIILGGTWSDYKENYQIWFVKRCFQAMNDFGDGLEKDYLNLNSKLSKINYREEPKNTEVIRNTRSSILPEIKPSQTYNQIIAHQNLSEEKRESAKLESATWEELFLEQRRNETNNSRCVGLVIETRPDNISPQEVIRIRKLGCTKTQIGFQSLDDKVLELNHRGHNVKATRDAVELLRWAGFKIHAHWMANLYGSSPKEDLEDFNKLFSDPDFCPDELKVYPCSLIETAELMDYYKAGLWKPFSQEELLMVIIEVIKNTPEYCRLTRIIRDIPGTDIVVGNKTTNFRQLAEIQMDKMGIIRKDIRSREIKNQVVTMDELELKIMKYPSSIGEEQFLQYVTKDNKIVGFLRLSLPKLEKEKVQKFDHPFISELSNSAMIREIHVYGLAANIGEKNTQKSQHLGLGESLIKKAKEIAKEYSYQRISVISAIGTKEYYRKKGFNDGEMYQYLEL